MEKISPFQQSVLEAPPTHNLALLGARGGGKTTALVLLALQNIEQFGENASALIIRRHLRSLVDFEADLQASANWILGNGYTYSRQEKILRCRETVGSVQLGAIESPGDYQKYQGQSFNLVMIDEVTLQKSVRTLRLLRSNIRAPEGVAERLVISGNPGGPLHGHVYKEHVQDRNSHKPYELAISDSNETEKWMSIFSSVADNPFVDQQAYIRRIREATRGDPAKLKQWLFGDWVQGVGALFPHWNEEVHVLRGLPAMSADLFRAKVAADFGMSSPSVGLLGGVARRPFTLANGTSVPAGSVIVWGESNDAIMSDEEDLSRSSEWPPDRLAERIAGMCANHGVQRPSIVVDNARGLQGETVIDMFQNTGAFWNVALPNKGRRAEGWAKINSMLLNAAEKDPTRPHLYISDQCEYLLATLPNAARAEKDPDDWEDTNFCPDHGGDALRYLLAEAIVKPVRWSPTNLF